MRNEEKGIRNSHRSCPRADDPAARGQQHKENDRWGMFSINSHCGCLCFHQHDADMWTSLSSTQQASAKGPCAGRQRVQGWIKHSLSLGKPACIGQGWRDWSEECPLLSLNSQQLSCMAKMEGWFSPTLEASWNCLTYFRWISGAPSYPGCGGSPFPPAALLCLPTFPCSRILPGQVTLSHSINSTNHLLTLWWVLATCPSGLPSPGPSYDTVQLLDVISTQQTAEPGVICLGELLAELQNVPAWYAGTSFSARLPTLKDCQK